MIGKTKRTANDSKNNINYIKNIKGIKFYQVDSQKNPYFVENSIESNNLSVSQKFDILLKFY